MSKRAALLRRRSAATATVCVVALLASACGVKISRLHAEQTTPALPEPDAGEAADGASPGGPTDADGGPGVQPSLKIGDTWVPRDKVIVFLHIGHSNMAGRAEHPADLRPYFHEPHPRLWSYRQADPITGTGPIELRPAVEPLAEDSASMGRAGPGMALLRSALARAPDVFVVSIGCARSGADYGLCESFVRGGLFYEHTMKPARALKGRVTFAGLFTMLGANEYWVRDTSKFSDCLRQLALDVRADLAEPDLPVLYGDYEMTAWGPYLPSLPGPSSVIAQLRMMPGKVPRSALIPTTDLPLEDDHHFNLIGHKTWGERAIQILHDRGWAPWSAP
jgi:hypothetical protein